MPEGSKVDRVYKALRREGKSEESAAKIAQSQTGEALATGKPPKEKVENIDFKDYRSWKTQAEQQGYKVVEHLTSRDGSPGQLSVAKDKDGNRKGEFNFGFNDKTTGGFLNTNTHFQNGRNRAMQEIENRMKFGNAIDPGVAQTELNLGYKAARQGMPRNAPNNTSSELKNFWLQGYDKYKQERSKDSRESEEWHDRQKERAYRRR